MLLKTLPFWIILAFALLQLTLLTHPPSPVFDEKFYIATPATLPTGHPPLGRAIIATSIKLLGDSPWAWRLPTFFASLAVLTLIYQIGQRHFSQKNPSEHTKRAGPFGRKVALFALLLLAFDTLWLTVSKLGMLDVFTALFTLASFFFLLEFFKKPKASFLLSSALLLGLSLSTKWSAVLLLPLFASLVLLRTRRLLFTFHFSLFTLLIYLLSHLPILASSGFTGFIGHNLANLATVASIQLKPGYLNAPPLFWFLTPFPLPIYKEGNALMMFFFNPLPGWFFLASLFFLIRDSLKKFSFGLPLRADPRSAPTILLLLTFLSLYFPWLLTSRDAFLNHMIPLLPFVYLIQGVFLEKLTDIKMGRFFAAVYLYLIFTTTLIAFPFLFAIPLDPKAWVSGVLLLAVLPVFAMAFPKKVWSDLGVRKLGS